MRFISLFSGIGGFELGFQRAGMTCDTACEIDPNAQAVLTRHLPHARLIDDVRKIGKDTHARGTIDLICGGFPCQDVSVAGKRAGLAGERSGLWFEFARVIDELEPQWVVIENVPGLLSSNAGRDFATILYALVKRGYGVCWRILDAQYFGVPQRRRRVFIVGSLGDGRSAQVLFEREGVPGNTAPGREARQDVAYSLRANPSHSGDKGDGGVNTTLVPVAHALSASPTATGRLDQNGQDFVISTFKKRGGFGWSETEGISPTLESEGGTHQGGPERIPLIANAFNGYTGGADDNDAQANHIVAFAWQQGDDSKFNANGRGRSWITRAGDYTGALSESRQDAVSGNFGVRRLMPVECERLQGFPDGWTEGQSDSVRYRQLGNAVAVPVVEWLGRRIAHMEDHHATSV